MKAIYLRKSRQGEEQDSLATHRSALVRKCEQNNWEYDIYEEIASGGDTGRSEMAKLLANIENYDAIVCMDVDRLSRDEIEAFEIRAELLSHGVQIITENGSYDFAKDDSMMYGIKAIFAAAELRKIKKRMKDGKINRFRNGEYIIGGTPPLGYKIVDKRLVIDEETAPIVRTIFELTAKGMGRLAVEDATGINPRYILSNTTYIGEVVFEIGGEKLFQSCPAIIDLELYVLAHEEIKRRYHVPKSRGVVRSIAQGLCRCKLCGNQMAINQKRILRCSTVKCKQRSIKVDVVEKWILDHIDTLSDDLSGVLWEKMEEVGKGTNKLGEEIQSIKEQITEAEADLKRANTLYIKGRITDKEYDEYESNVTDLGRKLKSLELKKARDEDSELVWMTDLSTDLHNFETADLTTRNGILRRLIDYIGYDRAEDKPSLTIQSRQ